MNQISVIPTDTLYGIVGSALSEEAVEKIYKLRQRNTEKPMIVLISRIEDLDLFNLDITDGDIRLLKTLWPNPVSVVLDCPDDKFKYLHRGTKTLAFRIPKNIALINLLNKLGPLVAPSANIEGQPPALTIEEAKQYFGDQIDTYVDVGLLNNPASTVLRLKNGNLTVLRQGSYTLPISN